ncbi:MAG: hypothetical protein OEQ29_10125 [Alphaproteobacteria bacterium]|nr:hypothetical protein [Alphaproteobacteria bacterium]
MLGIVGALLAALPLVLIPLMKVVLTRTHPPRWLTSGMGPQSIVVALLCCFIVGITISVDRFLAAKAISYVTLITQIVILGAGLVIGVLLALLAKREGEAAG